LEKAFGIRRGIGDAESCPALGEEACVVFEESEMICRYNYFALRKWGKFDYNEFWFVVKKNFC
jgi:hypothetical protein